MKTLILSLGFIFLLSCGRSQDLAGEYFVTGQGGEIVLLIEYAQGNQLQGVLTDMQGNTYQVQATEEDGEAFGQLINPQQGGMYFEAMREGKELYLTLIPAGADGQPNVAGSQEFVMKARSGSGHGGPAGNASVQSSAAMGGPLGGKQSAAANGWAGTFSGNFNGTPTTMTLQLNGNQLQGDINAGGYRYSLTGNISGQQSEGRFVDPQTQGAMNYQASLNGNQLTLSIQNPTNGQSSQLQFTRGSGSAASGGGANLNNSGGGQQYERDSRLVGGWSYTDSYTSGEYGFAAQWKLIINPDGSYIYGDGRVVGGGPGIGADSGSGGDVTRGQWRTENGVIYVNEGYGWQPYCRYTTNGQSLLMQFGDGSKQLWKRTN